MTGLDAQQRDRTNANFQMIALVVSAFGELVLYDLLARFAGFSRIREHMKDTRRSTKPTAAGTIHRVCTAVDIASCFYFRQVRCLHRSFAAARLLRRAGVEADLVIGSRPIPFLSHAWVEVDGRVVNDKQAYKRLLRELERM